MKQTMTTSQIADALRADDNAAWSYAGARALAEYLEQYEEDTGEDMEFDRVAIRCDFSEYATAAEAAGDYGWEPVKDNDEDQNETAALGFLHGSTTVIEFDGGVIIQNF
jgi:hypothetical protein